MKILVACEFSGIVRESFKKKGHDAWSCDLLPTEIPGQHIQGDVLEIINDGWDLMIGHPPCTYLCNAGVQYLKNNEERKSQMLKARLFFLKLLNSKINKICIENPVPHKYSNLPKYSQIIYPFWFGEKKSKRTCLWIKNLPFLNSTDIVDKGEFYKCSNGGTNPKWYSTTSKNRSRTFQGIADAMSDQWG
jgi:hypothetical protein